MTDNSSLQVLTVDTTAVRRNRLLKELKPDDLAESMNAFVGQIGRILERTAERVGAFEFSELEVHAQISGKGQFVLLGIGGEAGVTGGIKLCFRRVSAGQ